MIRPRRRWPSQLAVALGMAAAVAVATSVSLVQAAGSGVGVDRVLTRLGAKADMTVTQSNVVDAKGYSEFQGLVEQRDREVLGSLMVVRQRFAVSSELFPLTLNGDRIADDVNRPRLGSYERIEDHATIASGGFTAVPRDGAAWNATVSEATAQNLKLKAGDVYCASPINQPQEAVCLKVAAVWRPRDASDAYWAGLPPPATVFLVSRAQLYEIRDSRLHMDASAGTLLQPDPAVFRRVPGDEILSRLKRFRGLYSVRREDTFVATGLDPEIEAYVAHARTAAFAIELLAVPILAATLFYLGFVAGQVLDR